MLAPEINVRDDVRLIKPSIDDAALSLSWVSGDKGRALLELMGNQLDVQWQPSLKEEQARLREFIEGRDEINWAIEYNGKVIGAIWLDLRADRTMGPHIMIGEPEARGQGIGTAVMKAVIDWSLSEKSGPWQQFNYRSLTTRCKIENSSVFRINEKLGFKLVGNVYSEDGYQWQNFHITKDRLEQ